MGHCDHSHRYTCCSHTFTVNSFNLKMQKHIFGVKMELQFIRVDRDINMNMFFFVEIHAIVIY